MRKIASTMACVIVAAALTSCLSFVQGGGLFGGGVPDEPISIDVVYLHAEAPRDDPYPLFVGAEWIYRNATVDFNPEVHPSTLLSNQVLANVYCIDPDTGTAWECFAVRATDFRNPESINYMHRSDDGIYRLSEILRDQSVDFPGYLFLPTPFQRDRYLVYNIPKYEDGVLWNHAAGCSGDRNLLNVGGDGSCPVGSEVAMLSIIHRPETVGLSSIVNSVLGGYTTLFTEAWKLELYDGINDYPNYQWWSTTSDLAWLAAGIGIVKWVKGSNSLELVEFVHQDELLSLSPLSESKWYDCMENSRIVLQFRGSDPEGIDPTSWRITGIENLTADSESDEILSQIGDREFYNDIDIAGQPLDTGTYVYTYEAIRAGYATLRFEPSNADGGSGESVFRIKAGDFNIPPIATDDQFEVDKNVSESEFPVLENDYDLDPADRIRVSGIESLPSHGTVQAFDKTIVYTPDQDYVGGDSFDYMIEDNRGARTGATVDVLVVDSSVAP
ncbi:Ig-like domain-containing protein [Candidatus Bipolaricaulota bacterium]